MGQKPRSGWTPRVTVFHPQERVPGMLRVFPGHHLLPSHVASSASLSQSQTAVTSLSISCSLPEGVTWLIAQKVGLNASKDILCGI